MSEIFANFALSQESDNISNFPGSVSQKLEIENVGNFLLTQAEQKSSPCRICVGCYPAFFSSIGFLRPSIKRVPDAVHASCINPVGMDWLTTKINQ